jgi:hypothetical protein
MNWVRDVILQNVVDSSLQATQAQDFDNNDGVNKVINEVTKYFTMNVTFKKSSIWWEGFEMLNFPQESRCRKNQSWTEPINQ